MRTHPCRGGKGLLEWLIVIAAKLGHMMDSSLFVCVRRVALLLRRLIKEMDANYFVRGKLLLVCAPATRHVVGSKLIQMSGSPSRVYFALTT